MPVQPFRVLFRRLGNNADMSIENLRMKTIACMALCMMLCPSDIAPRSTVMDETGAAVRHIFAAFQVCFGDQKVTVTFHGIKNDTTRTGFTVTLPAASDHLLDPVAALRTYMDRTESTRASLQPAPVFISLSQPYHALTADTIRKVLDSAIVQAGLTGRGYSAKCFRPTGATYAVELGYDPEIVMRIGRWKTRSVFFDHYVHSQVPVDYTSAVLDHD